MDLFRIDAVRSGPFHSPGRRQCNKAAGSRDIRVDGQELPRCRVVVAPDQVESPVGSV